MFRCTNKFIIAVDVEVARLFVGERRVELLPQFHAVLWSVISSILTVFIYTLLCYVENCLFDFML